MHILIKAILLIVVAMLALWLIDLIPGDGTNKLIGKILVVSIALVICISWLIGQPLLLMG